jgi:uncharacterized protein YqkB
MKKSAIFLFIVFFTILPFASAQITFNQLSSVYNLGDSLTVTPTLIEDKSLNGMVKVTVRCGDSKFLFYTSPLEIAAGKEKKLEIPTLKIAEDQQLLGECYVETVLEDNARNVVDSKNTENFKISNNITVSIETNREEYLPEEKIVITGKAVKENGQEADGSASIEFDITFITDVKAGFFTQDIPLDKKIKSGEHELNARVIDANKNVGVYSRKITIRAVPSRIELQSNNESFLPGDRLETLLKVYDQADDEISAGGTLTLYDPDYIEVTAKNIDTQSNFEYTFPDKAKPGQWGVICFSSGIKIKKFVEVQKVSNLSINLENESLIIKNEGNIPYNDILTINFEKDGVNESITKQIALDVNGVLTIPLKGGGTYDLKVDSKINKAEFSGITLTGGATGIRNDININYIIVTAFVLLIAILAAISFIKRRKNKDINVKKVNLTEEDIKKAEEQ